ncbi:hypothetical protein N431DRAFT_510353 [Stipitochalara longipes BDJ]|nr:hypothetical protein N431DRAFT_510353 [Stipitochalara longipes BDJ]
MSTRMDDNDTTNREHQPKRPKRTRVQLACQRCKIRKQKCDGNQPECSTCAHLEVECKYIVPSTPKPQGAKLYIKALENRVAELETALTNGGLAEVGLDHWSQAPEQLQIEAGGDGQEDYSLLAAQTGLITSPAGTTPEYNREFEPSEIGRRSSMTSTFQEGSFPNALRGIQSRMADKLLQAYFKHVAVNFPLVHSAQIKDFHQRREVPDDPYEESVLNLVYALGGQFLEMRDKVLQLGDIRTLSYLLLLIQQCLRVPRDPGGWTFIGIAMRLCVELGLHRKKRRNLNPALGSELEKRLFWACYYFDRDISIALGRPPCISDPDIDVEPKIQSKIYRVDVLVNSLPEETEKFLESLAAWKNAALPQSNIKDDQNMNAYMLHYYKCTRLLLQPQLYESDINERYLKLFTEACIGVCETFRRLHDYFPVPFSTLLLQTVFLAGLTLVYCVWHSPSHAAIKTMSALSDCSIMLYIMTERWPNIKRYRDAFETIKRTVLELMADGKHQSKPTTMEDVFSSVQDFDLDMIGDINRDDLEQMFGDFTNERIATYFLE